VTIRFKIFSNKRIAVFTSLKNSPNVLSGLTEKSILTNNQKKLRLLLGAATASAICAMTQSASAVTLTSGTTFSTFLECINDGISLVVGQNPTDATGWQYAIDSSIDGVAGNDIGGNIYEIYSMGVRETADSIYVAINSNTPYTGNPDRNTYNGSIALGDLFINLDAPSTNFQEASNAGSLYAVRFIDNNDSGVPELGIYSNVTAKSVTDINSGFPSIQQYNQQVADYGGTPSFGDLPASTSYFDLNQSLNEIASGDFLAGINLLSARELTDTGFNWEQAPGQYTIGFKFDKSALPGGDSEPESVPEPGATAGLVLLGTLFIASRRPKA
jgi:hypothetical protein